jgi:tetratricopeptide (TPR) repeat protein
LFHQDILLKNLLAIVTISAATAGCAGLTSVTAPAAQDPALAAKPAVVAEVELTPAIVTELSSMEEEGPAVELTGDLLYKYLVAEIAEQRGHWQAAYISMLSVAQQTRDPRIARRAAEIAMNAKEIDAALNAIRLWHETAPRSQEATHFLMTLLIASGRMNEAFPLLQQELQEAAPPVRAAMILNVHRLLASSQDKPAAFQMLEKLLAPYKTMPEAHLSMAQAAYAMGNAERAVLEARAALEANPHSELAVLVLAQVLPGKQEAAALLENFLDKNPNSREIALAYARMLVEQGRFEQAQAQFQRLLEDQPDDLTSLYAVGLLNMQMRNLPQAERHLSRFLEVLATSPTEMRDPTQALLMLAQIAEERNNVPAALAWLDQIEAPTPEAEFELQVKRAQLTAKEGNIDGALTMLEEAKTDEEERQVQVAMAKAQILKAAGKSEQALAELQKTLKRFPDNTSLLYDYAMVAETLKRFQTTEQSLRKVIQLAPQNQHAYNALGYSLAERNVRLEEARQLIQRALELAPEDPFILDSMGWVEFRLGRLSSAEQILRKAYQLRPDPEIAAHLGEVLWAQGQRNDAKAVWREAASKSPDNDTLKNTLTRLKVDLQGNLRR